MRRRDFLEAGAALNHTGFDVGGRLHSQPVLPEPV